MPRCAIVVGLGYAGRRFVRVLQHVERYTPGLVTLVGGVDPEPGRVLDGLPCVPDLAVALMRWRPDVLCVTVGESHHAAVFDLLAGYRSCLVLSEKPLTTDLVSAARAAEQLAHHMFSMNLVERFSPVVSRYRSWAAEQAGLRVVRVDAQWGKHRIFDPRPTMGVLSELIHPIDLVQHLFLPLRYDSLHAHAIVSDLDVTANPRLDSVDATLRVGAVPVSVRASYAWPERVRTITALVRADGGLYRVVLTFDKPHWDCDRLQVLAILPDGRWSSVLDVRTDVADLSAEIAGVAKVEQFVRRSLLADPGPEADSDLVGLAGALDLQRLLNEIGEAAASATFAASYRAMEAK